MSATVILLRFRPFFMSCLFCCFLLFAEKGLGQQEAGYLDVVGLSKQGKEEEQRVRDAVKERVQADKERKAQEGAVNKENLDLFENTDEAYKKRYISSNLHETKKLYEQRLQKEGANNARSITTLSLLGEVCQKLHDTTAAIWYYERALALAKVKLGVGSTQNLMLRNVLGRLYMEESRFEEARAIFAENLEHAQRIFLSSHIMVTTPQEGLAGAYFELGQYGNAKKMYLLCLQSEEEKNSAKSLAFRDKIAQIDKKTMQGNVDPQDIPQSTPQNTFGNTATTLHETSDTFGDKNQDASDRAVIPQKYQGSLQTAPYEKEGMRDVEAREEGYKKERVAAPFYGKRITKGDIPDAKKNTDEKPLQENTVLEEDGWIVQPVEAQPAYEQDVPSTPSLVTQESANTSSRAQDLRKIPRDELPYIKPDPSKGLNPNFKGEAFKEPKSRFATERK